MSCISADGCAEGWVYNPANGYCYFFEERGGTWSEGREFCFEAGADLATIHSAEENAFIFGKNMDHRLQVKGRGEGGGGGGLGICGDDLSQLFKEEWDVFPT